MSKPKPSKVLWVCTTILGASSRLHVGSVVSPDKDRAPSGCTFKGEPLNCRGADRYVFGEQPGTGGTG